MKKHRFFLTGIISLSCLAFCVLASVACGAKSVGFQTVIRSLFHLGESSFDANVVQARIPRTVFGVLAGAALSISGALMQAITRNPIADPSILGVNTGASLFVVFGIAFLHINKGIQYIGLAFAGAALTAILVYGLASIGHGGAGSGRCRRKHRAPVSGQYHYAPQHPGHGSVPFLADRKYQRRRLG